MTEPADDQADVSAPIDIRNATPDGHWEHFGQAWTALLSYRYLGKLTPVMDAGVEIESMPLRHDMRNAAGGVMAAPLCLAAPEPYWLDDAVIPAPVVMSYEILDPAYDVNRVEVIREVIHLGRTMGFSRSRVVDADNHDRVIAVSSGTGVSLGPAPGGFVEVDNPPIDVVDHPDMPRLAEVFGAIKLADEVWQLPPLSPEHASPHAALHIGPIVIVMEAAAMDAAAQAVGTDQLQIESWTVMMERPGLVGPFVATAVVPSAVNARLAVEITLRDFGKSDRVIATAVAIFRWQGQMGT
jgi:acyl-coenzyme A thioesterase PaaI-like protein